MKATSGNRPSSVPSGTSQRSEDRNEGIKLSSYFVRPLAHRPIMDLPLNFQ